VPARPADRRIARKKKLDATHIVDAAQRLASRVGVAKLSMRAVARELRVTPTALYHHVPNKNALLKLLRTPGSGRITVQARARVGGDPALTERDIIDASLGLIRRGGVDKLSMRALARELDVTAMAIYHHVPNKRALLVRIADFVLAAFPTPEPTGKNWENELREHALVSWERMSQYPGLLPIQPSETGRASMRYALSILLAAGFDESAAQLAITTYYTFMLGVVRRYAQNDTVGARRRSARASAGAQTDESYRQLVLFGIDAVIARLQQSRRARRPRTPMTAEASALFSV
jgi:AcrR family transcriptional regulator